MVSLKAKQCTLISYDFQPSSLLWEFHFECVKKWSVQGVFLSWAPAPDDLWNKWQLTEDE